MEKKYTKKIEQQIQALINNPKAIEQFNKFGIDTEHILEIEPNDLFKICEQIRKQNVSGKKVYDELEKANKTDSKLYKIAKKAMLFNALYSIGSKYKCKTTEQIYDLAEPVIYSGLWTKDEITSAINEIQRQQIHHQSTNPFYKTVFDDIDILRILASKNVWYQTIKEEIEKEKLDTYGFKFYEEALLLAEFGSLAGSIERLINSGRSAKEEDKLDEFYEILHDIQNENKDEKERIKILEALILEMRNSNGSTKTYETLDILLQELKNSLQWERIKGKK